jgi:small subunit ribosomal protein S6
LLSLACLEQDATTRREEILLADNKQYEVLYIVRPNLDEEAVDRTVATVEEHMKALGLNIESTEKKGRRRLAYEVKKMRDGYYVLTLFTAATSTITGLNRYLTLNEDIIRHLVVVREEEPVTT